MKFMALTKILPRRFLASARRPRAAGTVSLLTALILAGSGCTVLTYRGPSGEHFTRTSLGAATSIGSLSVEAGTNGIRRVELQGYQNDTLQAFGAVTEAAVRAALKASQ